MPIYINKLYWLEFLSPHNQSKKKKVSPTVDFSYRFGDKAGNLHRVNQLRTTVDAHILIVWRRLYGNVRAVDISKYLWKYVPGKLRFNGGLINCIVREFAIRG